MATKPTEKNPPIAPEDDELDELAPSVDADIETVAANAGYQVKFRVLHTMVGSFSQNDEITQEQLGVNDGQLERLLDLGAVEPILVNPRG